MDNEETVEVVTEVVPLEVTSRQRRGFGAMSPERQREIAAEGGRMSHVLGRGHKWTSEAAREAGRKGGKAARGGRGKVAT